MEIPSISKNRKVFQGLKTSSAQIMPIRGWRINTTSAFISLFWHEIWVGGKRILPPAVFSEGCIYKCRTQIKFFWRNFIRFVVQKSKLVTFGGTFTKSAKAPEFSAVIDLESLKKQKFLFVLLKGWRQFWWQKTAFFSKILLCLESRDKYLLNEPH